MNYHPHWHEYNAAAHLLLGIDVLAHKTEDYVLPETIDWKGIVTDVSQNVSTTEYIFIRIAYDLWCGREVKGFPAVGFRLASSKLERRQLDRVVEAMRILASGDYRFLDGRKPGECEIVPL